MSPETPALAGGFFTTALPGKSQEGGRQPRWTHGENFMFSFSCRVLKYKFDQNEDLSKLIRRNIIMITLDLSQSMLYL